MNEQPIEENPLFEAMLEKAAAKKSFINPQVLRTTIIEGTRKMAEMLNRATIHFPDYTLHNERHALRVAFLMHRLLPAEALAAVNVIDCALLILSAYAHDLGMAIGKARKAELLASDAYQPFLLSHDREWQQAERAKEEGRIAEYQSLHDRLFQDFLRGSHHLESEKIVAKDLRAELSVQGHSLADPVAKLSRSHGEDLQFVMTLDNFLFASAFECDLAFLGCVLRLADYLDLDPDRAPDTLFSLIKPATFWSSPPRSRSRRISKTSSTRKLSATPCEGSKRSGARAWNSSPRGASSNPRR